MKNFKIKLNNKYESLENSDPSQSLLDWIREEKKLTGTKEGCAEGDCGACSVLISPVNGGKSKPVNSCILKLGQVVGSAITTVEGLGDSNKPNIVQETLVKNSGSQCGFCTPGIVIALSGLLNNENNINNYKIHDALAGNLCRCTGYNPIIKSMQNINYKKFNIIEGTKWYKFSSFENFNTNFYFPSNINQALKYLANNKNIKIIAGGTDLNLNDSDHTSYLMLNRITSLRKIKLTNKSLIVGSSSTLDDILPVIENKLPYLSKIIRRFGSTQIRSMATIAGNISTASPIGDIAPTLIVLGAVIELISSSGTRKVPIEKFFKGYRKTIIKNSEFIKNIIIPLPSNEEFHYAWKLSKRYDQDISTISMAANLKLIKNKLISCKISFGGIAEKPIRSIKIENYFLKNYPTINLKEIDDLIKSNFNTLSDLRGSSFYRKQASIGLIQRLLIKLSSPKIETEVFI